MMDRILSRTVWPTGILVAAVLLEASLLGLGVDDLDEGYFVQQGARVLHGQLPYRDFETLYAPGLAFVHAALFALFGGPGLVGPRALALVARAGLALALFAMARPLVRNPWWAAIPGLILLAGFDDAPVRWEPHPGWLSSLFAVLAAACLNRGGTRKWLLASGLAAAASYAFKQNTGIFILGAALIWSWPGSAAEKPRISLETACRAPRRKLSHEVRPTATRPDNGLVGRTSRSGWPLLGFGAGTFAWLVPFVIAGVPLVRLGVLIGAVNESGLISAPEPTMLIPLAGLLGGIWLVRRDSNPTLRLYLLTGVALFLTEFPRMDTLHLLWSAPLLLLLGAVSLERLPRSVAVVSLVATAFLVWPTLSGRITSLTLPRAVVDGVSAPTQTALDIQSTVEDVQRRTRPGEPIFVYPTSPLLYVLADRPNPTRFDHLNPGAANSGQIQEVIDDLERANVRIVVVSDYWRDVWGLPGPNAPLEDWLFSRFTTVATHGAYRILEAG